jgi:hypothetical protein
MTDILASFRQARGGNCPQMDDAPAGQPETRTNEPVLEQTSCGRTCTNSRLLGNRAKAGAEFWLAQLGKGRSYSGYATLPNCRPCSRCESVVGVIVLFICMDPTPFASFLFVMSKRSACMYPACQMGSCRSTPAASMRSAHPVLSKIAARQNWQPARKTGFRMLVQPISSSL